MENYKITFELETSIGVSGASGTGKSTFVLLIELLIYSSEQDLTCNRPGAMN